MVFYFSGTGNSLWVAKELARRQGEHLYSIAVELKKKDNTYTYTLNPGEKAGFVFPVYAWAPPEPVLDFIRRVKLDGYRDQYVYAACTCGDETGNAIKLFRHALDSVNIRLNAGFSVEMPNNYIIGFNVDPEELKQKKLTEAERTVSLINEAVAGNKPVFEYSKGRFPFFKTRVIGFLFNTFGRNAKPFRATGSCTSCGLCERVCPTGNIKLLNGKPAWENNCTQCLACINRCPSRAIEYGKWTVKKGRYYHPSAFQ